MKVLVIEWQRLLDERNETYPGRGSTERECDARGDAECRAVEYAYQAHETIPAELIVKAGLLAASEIFNMKLPRTGLRKSSIRLLSGKLKHSGKPLPGIEKIKG